MTTSSFDEAALAFDDDTDVAPTNDVAATRPYDELNVSSDATLRRETPPSGT